MIHYSNPQIVFQEVPDEISLALSISGCSLRCKGCHSPFTWKENYGEPLTPYRFMQLLEKYPGMVSCVLFYGGEWAEEELLELLKLAQHKGLKTALYTGQDTVSQDLMDKLTYLKTGRWMEERGGLDNPNTNQKFIHVSTGKILNHLFQK